MEALTVRTALYTGKGSRERHREAIVKSREERERRISNQIAEEGIVIGSEVTFLEVEALDSCDGRVTDMRRNKEGVVIRITISGKKYRTRNIEYIYLNQV